MASQVQIEFLSRPRIRETPPLLRSFAWTLGGNVVYAACQWGMLSALAKLGSAALVGRLALGLSITAPVFMFTNLQLRGVQATDARSEFAFSDYFTLRFVASLAGLFVVLLVVCVGRYDWATGAVILLTGLSKMVESLSDVIAGLLQKSERLDRVAISLMIRGSISIAGFAIAFKLTRSLVVAVAILVAIWLSVFLSYDLRQARSLMDSEDRFFRFRLSQLKTLIVVSAPLGIVMTLVSLNVNIPRYLLEHALGPADLGIFASLAYSLVAVNLVVNALGQATSSRLAHMYAAKETKRFRAALARLIAVGAILTIVSVPVAAAVGRPLLTILYRPEYGRHVQLFVIMVTTAGVCSIGSFLGYGMTAARKFPMQVPVTAVSALTTVLFCVILISRWGSMGAAYALLIGSFVQVIGSALVLHGAVVRLPRLG